MNDSVLINHPRNQEFEPNQCQWPVIWRTVQGYFHQCRRKPQADSEYCWQHQPERMEASRQKMIKRRIGVASNDET